MNRPDRAPRRRLDVDARRAAILTAARDAFTRARYADVVVGRVAEAAGASPALVFHYFGSKSGLYEEVVRGAIEGLEARQQAADRALGEHVSARDRVRTTLGVYLDHIAAHPDAWAAPLLGGEEPPGVVALRQDARERYVAGLRSWLGLAGDDWPRHDYALWGYFGFLDQACLAWVGAGCPAERRDGLIEASLGALEGALGDWGR